jgi:hypothetical protein
MLSVVRAFKAQPRFVLVTTIVLLLGGCASARVEQSRTATTGMTTEESLVILSRASYNERETEESFTDCLSDELRGGKRPIRLMSEAEFKDQLYPWFEPRTAPDSSDDLARLFAQPGVQQRIDENNVRFIAWIDGDTITTDRGGSFSCTVSTVGGCCFGVTYWEEDASYEAAIWDLQNLTTAGEISADASGTSYIAGLVLPIPIMARPGNAACKGLALQLKEFLQSDG